MKYMVEITEILCRIVEVEADNEDDAIDKVQDEYSKENIVLDYHDYCDTEFTIV